MREYREKKKKERKTKKTKNENEKEKTKNENEKEKKRRKERRKGSHVNGTGSAGDDVRLEEFVRLIEKFFEIKIFFQFFTEYILVSLSVSSK